MGLSMRGTAPPSIQGLGDNGYYFHFGAGLATTRDSDGPGESVNFDEGHAIPVAFGRRFGANDGNAYAFDLELEGIWTDQDVSGSGTLQAVTDVTVLGLLVNGVGEVALNDRFGLYAGGGIGLAMLDAGTTSDAFNDFDDEDGPFLAWQAKAGLRLWASKSTAWNIGYRFLNIDDATIDDNIGSASFGLQTEQHILEIGVRFGL